MTPDELEDLVSPALDLHVDDDSLTAMKARVLASAGADQPLSDATGRQLGGQRRRENARGRNRLRSRARRASVTALGALAMAVVVFVLAAAVTSGRSGPAEATSLDQAISTLEGTTSAPSTSGSLGVTSLPDGDYVYRLEETADEVTTQSAGGRALTYLQPQTVQYWQRADGSGLERLHTLPPVFSSTLDRTNAGELPVAPDQELTLPASATIAPASYRYLSTLPLAVSGLSARLAADSGERLTPQRTFQLVLDLLGSGPPPKVQAVLYRLAGSLSGAREVDGAVTDGLGRSADAVEVHSDGRIYELLFDPGTGAYLGTQALDPTGRVDSYRLVRTVSVAATLPGAASDESVGSPSPSPEAVGASTPVG